MGRGDMGHELEYFFLHYFQDMITNSFLPGSAPTTAPAPVPATTIQARGGYSSEIAKGVGKIRIFFRKLRGRIIILEEKKSLQLQL